MKMNDLLKLNKSDLFGKVICFPTDTVYGVGALIEDSIAINKIYELKHRDYQKPLAVLASCIDDILPYIETPDNDVYELMKKYWPGALTIIFNKNKQYLDLVNQNFDTIGFRIPNAKIALAILSQFGPMATTSINISGEAPLNDYDKIMLNFSDKIDYMIEDRMSSSNVSSTVIDATVHPYKILRKGDLII